MNSGAVAGRRALRPPDAWWIAAGAAAALALFAWRTTGAASWSWQWSWVLGAVGYAGFGALSVVLAIVDARTLRLPNRLVLAAGAWLAAWLVPAALSVGEPARVGWAALAALLFLVLFAGLWLCSGSAFFGGGDAKLAPICGFAAAWIDLGAVLIFPFAVAVATLPGLVFALRNRERQLAYGPSLLVAAWLAVAFPSEWVL